MALPQHIAIRHGFPDLKGRIMDIPGIQGGITMLDPNGNVLAKGFSLKIVGSKTIQPDPSKAPFEVATIKVTKATADGGRTSYTVTQPVQRIFESFPEVVREAVGEDAEFDSKEPYDKLLLLTLASSSKDTEHLAPTVNASQWIDEATGYWMDHGKMVCSRPVEICREIKTPEGETVYRLRVPRPNQPGFHDYTTCSWDELNSGTFHFSEQGINIHSAVKTAMAMLGRYESLNTSGRLKQEHEEYTQPEREAKAALDNTFWGFARRR